MEQLIEHAKAVTDELKARTRLFNAQAAEIEARLSGGVMASAPALAAAEPGPKKERKPRAPKEDAIQAAPTPAADTPAAATPPPTAVGAAAVIEPSEDESLKEVRALAKTYVQRFANQVDGIKSFRELIAATTGVARIDDLVHSQRLLVIAKAKGEIAKGKVAPAAPAETAGTAV